MMNYAPYARSYAPGVTPPAGLSRVPKGLSRVPKGLSRVPKGLSRVPGWQRMLAILVSITVIVTLLLAVKPEPRMADAAQNDGAAEGASQVQEIVAGDISPLFAAPVKHWAPQIEAWAGAYGLDPNLVATIMQVESCGDPVAVSSAGAQGLFQVMPFHFTPGEDTLDPDVNARRGLAYFAERLQQTGGDVGRALAGYNGGQRAAASSWEEWPAETRRYFQWTTGIYQDVRDGRVESPMMERWLQAGGASLCRQAARRLDLTP